MSDGDERPEGREQRMAAFAAAGAFDIPEQPAARAQWIVDQGVDGLERLLLDLHEQLAPNVAHEYRSQNVSLGQVIHPFPPAEVVDHNIRSVLTSVVDAIAADPSEANLRRVGLLLSAAVVNVHPFANGNGRSSRAIGLLIAAGPGNQDLLDGAVDSSGPWSNGQNQLRQAIQDSANYANQDELRVHFREWFARHPEAPRPIVDVRVPGLVDSGRDKEFFGMLCHEVVGGQMVGRLAIEFGLLDEAVTESPDGNGFVLEWQPVYEHLTSEWDLPALHYSQEADRNVARELFREHTNRITEAAVDVIRTGGPVRVADKSGRIPFVSEAHACEGSIRATLGEHAERFANEALGPTADATISRPVTGRIPRGAKDSPTRGRKRGAVGWNL